MVLVIEGFVLFVINLL